MNKATITSSRPPPSTNGTVRTASTGRAVSQVVSFVLTFAMLMSMIGLLYTTGVGSLGDLRKSEQTENAERVFVSVADSFGELQENQAPKRAGSLDLDIGATLTVEDGSAVNVTVNGPDWNDSIPMRSLEYRLDQTTIAYESGAVFRKDGEYSAMIATPSYRCSPSTRSAVLSVVTLTAPSADSLGSGTATITGIQRSTTLVFPDQRSGPAISGVDNVTVNVTSSFRPAWNRYFGAPDNGWTDPDGDGTYTCEDVDRVFVRTTNIEVRLVR